MNDRAKHGQVDPRAGLCATCVHARLVVSDRGSQFVMCDKARTDARFARYPRLPVEACGGYQRAERTD
jgi:hypothetical protein